MLDMFSVIRSSYESFFSGGGFGILFAACLFFLLWRKQRKNGAAFFWPCLLLLAVIFCPLTAGVIMKLIGETVYWRVFWLLPIVPVMAFAGTELATAVRGKAKQILLALLCIALVVWNGKFVFTDQYFENRENNYKLPTNVIWVADAINEHAQENRIKKKKIVAPINISTYIRIYDATILQRYGRNMITKKKPSQLYTEINAQEHDFAHLAERARMAKCRYVVLKAEKDNREAMEELNFEMIYEDDSYTVYFNLDYQKKKE